MVAACCAVAKTAVGRHERLLLRRDHLSTQPRLTNLVRPADPPLTAAAEDAGMGVLEVLLTVVLTIVLVCPLLAVAAAARL